MSGGTRIYTYGGEAALRNHTVASLLAGKGTRRFVQTTAANAEEAAAAEAVGIDLLSVSDLDLPELRAAAPTTFMTAALSATDYATPDDILRAAIRAAGAGADAIYTLRSLKTVEMLAREGLAVQGHLGLVPRLSTRIGGLRAVGRSADEALQLARAVQRLEEAGAYAVELECVAAEVTATIRRRSTLMIHSIGSGPDADVVFLFQEDVCGATAHPPRHARAFADLARLADAMRAERRRGLVAYRRAVEADTYPGPAEIVQMHPQEIDAFLEGMERLQS